MLINVKFFFDCIEVITQKIKIDHKRLKTSPAVYELSERYNFHLSLFDRLMNSGMKCPRLSLQHRMRPEISRLICPIIYKDGYNHESSDSNFPNVLGVKKNVYFITHEHKENPVWVVCNNNNASVIICYYIFVLRSFCIFQIAFFPRGNYICMYVYQRYFLLFFKWNIIQLCCPRFHIFWKLRHVHH